MNQQDREFLNREAKMIFESDLTQAQILVSLEIAHNKGLTAGKSDQSK